MTMEQYIPRSVLLTEIKRRRDAALMRQQNLESIGQETVLNKMVANELNKIISLIDNLEVKDLELTWEDIERINDISIRLDGTEEAKEMSYKEFYQEVLKRFKAQKGEEV